MEREYTVATVHAPVQSNRRGTTVDICPFCRRESALTFHHLIPRKVHRRARFSKRYDRSTLNLGIRICRLCHSGIHACHDEMRLATDFNTPQALCNDPTLQKHFRWVSKQKRQ